MLVIRWTDENEKEKEQFNSKKEVENRVSKIGTDGAILKWLDTSCSNGVIIYYNTIIGYISYEAEAFNIDKIKELHLETALQNMTEDELIDMIIAYDSYVQEVDSTEDIHNLLTWV